MRSRVQGLLVVLAVCLAPAIASADERAIAQQAFKEGRALMAAGKFAEACPKFAAAAELSPTAGVRLNLADCYVKLGRTASAWAKASEALGIAERTGDTAASTLAHTQMNALEPKLSYVTLVVAKDSAPPGLEVTFDGEKIPAAVWGTAIPVDLGTHTVAASAAGHPPWSTQTTVAADGIKTSVTVVIPGASDAPSPLAPPPPPGDHAAGSGGWSRGAAHAVAIASAGLGVVGLGLGTAFGVDASGKKSDYQQQEVGGRCVSAACATLTQQAYSSATVSTVGFVVGGALVAAGVVLWLTAPASTTETRAVAVVPIAGPGGAGAGVLGRF